MSQPWSTILTMIWLSFLLQNERISSGETETERYRDGERETRDGERKNRERETESNSERGKNLITKESPVQPKSCQFSSPD